MQARVCVQTSTNGDVQGFLYLDEGAGESLVTTSSLFAAGSSSAEAFSIAGTKGGISATSAVNVTARTVDFSVTITDAGGTSTSAFSRALSVQNAPC